TRFSRDWSSDVCSSDLEGRPVVRLPVAAVSGLGSGARRGPAAALGHRPVAADRQALARPGAAPGDGPCACPAPVAAGAGRAGLGAGPGGAPRTAARAGDPGHGLGHHGAVLQPHRQRPGTRRLAGGLPARGPAAARPPAGRGQGRGRAHPRAGRGGLAHPGQPSGRAGAPPERRRRAAACRGRPQGLAGPAAGGRRARRPPGPGRPVHRGGRMSAASVPLRRPSPIPGPLRTALVTGGWTWGVVALAIALGLALSLLGNKGKAFVVSSMLAAALTMFWAFLAGGRLVAMAIAGWQLRLPNAVRHALA